MDSDEIRRLVSSLRESGYEKGTLEVKAAKEGAPKSLLETISAFANRKGGVILLGVDERASFKPLKINVKQVLSKVQNMCANDFTPPVRPDIDVVPFEGAQIVVIQVPEFGLSEKPCYITARGRYNGAYIRTGEGDHKLSEYEVNRLVENREQPRWDADIVAEATLGDLDTFRWQQFLHEERARHPRLFAQNDDVDVLRKLSVIKQGDDGQLHPTLAGLLCFGQFPQQFFPRLSVTYAVYPTEGKFSDPSGTRFIDSGELLGPIPDMVHDAVAAVRTHMVKPAVIRDSLRETTDEYPIVAVREAITNALMHRDYSPDARGAQVQINIFPNRIEFLNPGGLYGVVNEVSLMSEGLAASRNQILSRLLEYTPYRDGGFVAENRGSGFSEILALLADRGLPAPDIRSTLTSFQLTFFNTKDDGDRASKSAVGEEPYVDVARAASSTSKTVKASAKMSGQGGSQVVEKVGGQGGGKVSAKKAAVLRCVEARGEVSSREIAAATGLNLASVRRYLQQLVEGGYLERMSVETSPNQSYRRVR